MGYKLPDDLRKEFREPIGQLFVGNSNSSTKNAIEYIKATKAPFTASIGDFCSKSLIEQNFYPDLIIFDETTRYGGLSIDLNKDVTYQIESINEILCKRIEEDRVF